MINKPLISVALNTSTFIPITLPTTQQGRRFTCCTTDGTACLIADNVTGTGAYTTLADVYLIIENGEPKGGTLCYVKGTTTAKFQAFVER